VKRVEEFQAARQAAQDRASAVLSGRPPVGSGQLREPDLRPTDARLEPFHRASVHELGRYVRCELTLEQLHVNLRVLARRHGVEQLVRWADYDFGLPLDAGGAGSQHAEAGAQQ